MTNAPNNTETYINQWKHIKRDKNIVTTIFSNKTNSIYNSPDIVQPGIPPPPPVAPGPPFVADAPRTPKTYADFDADMILYNSLPGYFTLFIHQQISVFFVVFCSEKELIFRQKTFGSSINVVSS